MNNNSYFTQHCPCRSVKDVRFCEVKKIRPGLDCGDRQMKGNHNINIYAIKFHDIPLKQARLHSLITGILDLLSNWLISP